MRKRSEIKIIVGVLVWIALLCVAALYARNTWTTTGVVARDVTTFLSTPKQNVELQFERDFVVRTGVPIFLEKGTGQTELVGRMTRVGDADSIEEGYVYIDSGIAELFASSPDVGTIDYLSYHETPQSFAWVIEMMLPPETREKIKGLIVKAYQDHQREIVSAFRPILEKSLKEASEIIREDLRTSLARHESDLQKLGDRFQKELVEKELVPLVKNEIWPVVQQEAEPLVTEIGQEMWREVSIWRFTWKYLYDRSPLPERNLAKKEFQDFVETKASPILESKMGDIISVQQSILKRISQNEKVKSTVKESIRKVSRDEEVQSLLTQIFREVFVQNERLEKVLRGNWESPDAQRAMAMTNRKLDPMITEIGQTLFGSPNEEITPEFARVLRNRILHKDDRWFMIHSKDQSDESPIVSESGIPILKVRKGVTGTENPFYFHRGLEAE